MKVRRRLVVLGRRCCCASFADDEERGDDLRGPGEEFEDAEAREEEAVAVEAKVEDNGGYFGLVGCGYCLFGFGGLGNGREMLCLVVGFCFDVAKRGLGRSVRRR